MSLKSTEDVEEIKLGRDVSENNGNKNDVDDGYGQFDTLVL
jgi:hypothetical protein